MTDSNLPMDVIQPEPPQPLISDEPERQAPYPVEALGNLLGAAVSVISSGVRVPESLAAQSILSAAAMAAQPHANLTLDGRTLPLSLFFLTVAESGDRKSGADRPALKAHHERQRALVSAYREQLRAYRIEKAAYDKACEALLKQSKGDNMEAITGQVAALPEPQTPRQPFILAEEPTLEGLQKAFLRGQSSMGLFSDEGGQFFGGNAMKPENLLKSVSGLSKFWDGAPINRTRASDEESASCYGNRLSAHLMMQPVVAKEVFANPIMQGQGFLARFLVAWPESLAGTRLYRSIDLSIDPSMIRYWQCMTRLLETPPCLNDQGELDPQSLTLTPEAKALWITEHDRIEQQLGRLGDYTDIKAVGSKAAEQILRIAGVLAVVEGRVAIDSDTMKRGIELGCWYLGEALRLCYPVRQDPELVKAQKLIDWIHSKGWSEFDARTLQREGPSFIRKSANTRNRLLNKLVIARHLFSDDGKKIYRINTFGLATFATSATAQAFQGVEPCDTSATPCDKTATRQLSPDFVATLSQPVAIVSQAESPINTRLVAEVANVASTEASDGKNFKINPLSSAQSTQSAQSQKIQGIGRAHEMRRPAQVMHINDGSASSAQKSAQACALSAYNNYPVNTGSAHNAHFAHESETEKTQPFLGAEKLPDDIRQWIRNHRSELLAELDTAPTTKPVPDQPTVQPNGLLVRVAHLLGCTTDYLLKQGFLEPCDLEEQAGIDPWVVAEGIRLNPLWSGNHELLED